MGLEACMLLIDNSEYMRNGDYQPNRFDAQSDAVSVVFGTKTQSNPENTVGVMTMAGKAPEVLVTPTQDIGKILTALHNTRIGGTADLTTGIQVAQLALKHRQNKNLRQRIIVFIGSPLQDSCDDKSLVKLGKKLKKNNIAVDIVSFGEQEQNAERLQAFVESVNSGENSHLVTIPAGPYLISDRILASPILSGDTDMPGGMEDVIPGASGGGSGGAHFEFGIDPSLDPELAMALRMSLEEEQARQQASAAAAGPQSSLPSISESTGAIPGDGDAEEDALLAKALSMSQDMGEDVDMKPGDDAEDELSEEDAIARAIEMSMKGNEGDDDAMDSSK